MIQMKETCLSGRLRVVARSAMLSRSGSVKETPVESAISNALEKQVKSAYEVPKSKGPEIRARCLGSCERPNSREPVGKAAVGPEMSLMDQLACFEMMADLYTRLVKPLWALRMKMRSPL